MYLLWHRRFPSVQQLDSFLGRKPNSNFPLSWGLTAKILQLMLTLIKTNISDQLLKTEQLESQGSFRYTRTCPGPREV